MAWALPWKRRGEAAASKAVPEPPPSETTPSPLLRRTATTRQAVRHEWLDVTVARLGAQGPIPLANARVVVRPWPPGEPRPLDPVARAVTGPDGSVTFHLPTGRYAVAAAHGGESKAVSVVVERSGRAHVLLERPPRLVTLAVEVVGPNGSAAAGVEVEAVSVAPGGPSCRSRADDHGVALLALTPGAHDLRVAGVVRRVEVATDARVRMALPELPRRVPVEAVASVRPYERPREGSFN